MVVDEFTIQILKQQAIKTIMEHSNNHQPSKADASLPFENIPNPTSTDATILTDAG